MIKHFVKTVLAATICFSSSTFAVEAEAPPIKQTLFKNVMVFDGSNDKLYKAEVLVKGNMIDQVSTKSITVSDSKNTTVIESDTVIDLVET